MPGGAEAGRAAVAAGVSALQAAAAAVLEAAAVEVTLVFVGLRQDGSSSTGAAAAAGTAQHDTASGRVPQYPRPRPCRYAHALAATAPGCCCVERPRQQVQRPAAAAGVVAPLVQQLQSHQKLEAGQAKELVGQQIRVLQVHSRAGSRAGS